MTNNNSPNKFDRECAFAEMLVAVLYDEATASERLELNSHAAQCNSCRQELIEFGAIRNSIGEYRETILRNATAPEIVLPQNAFNAPSEKSGWLTNMRALLFSPNNGWQTTTAFAAFLICAALVFVFASGILQSQGDRQFVQNDLKTMPTPQKSNEIKAVESPQANVSATPKPPTTDAASVPASNPLEAKSPQTSAPRNNNAVPRAKIVSPEVKPRKQKIQPARQPIDLEFDDDAAEDDSLRLSDLLDEVGSVE